MSVIRDRSNESGRVLFTIFRQARSYGNCLVLFCETSSGKCAELACELSMTCFLSVYSESHIPPVLPKASCTFLFCAMFACDFPILVNGRECQCPIGKAAKFQCPANI